MSWIADAHNDWHTVNGWDALCPLDCFDPADDQDYREPAPEADAGDWDAYAAELFEESAESARWDAERAAVAAVPDPWGAPPF